MSARSEVLAPEAADPVSFARTSVVWRRGGLSGRLAARSVVVAVALLAGTLVAGVVSLAHGEFAVPLPDVVRYLLGADGDLARTVVVEWRLPRVVAAVVFGAALGMSGAIFQSLTRNPLGSPDIIGFNTGAYTGALVAMLLIGGDLLTVTVSAVLGGLVTAGVVYALALRKGTPGYRLIVVGIGVSAMLTAFNQWVILEAELDTAISAAIWGQGSLNGIRWEQAAPAVLVVAPAMLACLFLGRRLAALDLGDDAAAALGLRVERTRLLALMIGVTLTAVATAVAGPIAFVSLCAPQLARRLVRAPGLALAPAALTGAFLLVVSDLIAARAFAPIQLPVGVVTVSIGGIYLVYLLLKEARSSPNRTHPSTSRAVARPHAWPPKESPSATTATSSPRTSPSSSRRAASPSSSAPTPVASRPL